MAGDNGVVDWLAEVRRSALALPGAWEDHPWGEHPVFKTANGKVFVFCGVDQQGDLVGTVKLPPAEGEEALSLPFVSVARYVGRFGWVTARVSNEFELEVVLDWLVRSHAIVSHGRGRLGQA